MIERYRTQPMTDVWSRDYEIACLRKASVMSACATDAQYKLDRGFIHATVNAIYAVSQGEWADLEAELDHDIAAWVEAVRRHLDPEQQRWWHRGRTSSDLAETVLSLRVDESIKLIHFAAFRLVQAITRKAVEYRDDPILGRTHGQAAEPTTIGRRWALMALEGRRASSGLKHYGNGKLSGPVGTNNHRSHGSALAVYGLTPVPSSQIVPRWRLADVLLSVVPLVNLVTGVATEIRLGSQTGVDVYREVSPSGAARGSSAMPQKRNPIRSERATGLARLTRQNLYTVIEASSDLWNERDISHSSVERTALPDALMLTEYLLLDMARVVDNLAVDARLAAEDIHEPTGAGALEELLDHDYTYYDAYRRVQQLGPTQALYQAGLRADDGARTYNPDDEPDLWAEITEMARTVGVG